MSEHNESFNRNLDQVLKSSMEGLEKDVELKRQLQQSRMEALKHLPENKEHSNFTSSSWMFSGGAAFASVALVAVAIWFAVVPQQQVGPALDPQVANVTTEASIGDDEESFITAAAEIGLDSEVFDMDPEFLEWALQNAEQLESQS